MNAGKVRRLENLLQQAMGSVVMKDSFRGNLIAIGDYLTLLASHRQSFYPDHRMLAARFEPEIRDNAAKEQLLKVVSNTLEQYIHDDTLQSAIIVTGGVLNGFKISDLINHLLTIAFSRGVQHAARSFYECAEGSGVGMQFITLLDGITLRCAIDISDGIRLVPIPNDSRDFPPLYYCGSSW